ncbi:MAG: fused MFS/spermidine synthase [Candidatus Eisenbacteria bacterium]
MQTRTVPLILCFVISGATSLMLEVAWSKELSYLLGNSLHGVSTVVAAFMAGLAIGSAIASRLERRVANPVRAYGAFQLAIGLYALVSLPLFRAVEPGLRGVFVAAGGGSGLGILLRFAVVFLLLALPVVLMGMTLPLLARAVTSEGARLERGGGLLYGLNTIGACVGTMIAGYGLIPTLGLLRTTWVAGVLDLATAALALLWLAPARHERSEDHAATTAGVRWNPTQHLLAAIFAFSGAIAMIYEVAWFRLLGLTLGPSVYAFSCMLAVYLAGIGLGSTLAAPIIGRWSGVRTVAILQCALAALGLGGLFLADRLPEAHLAAQARLLPALGATGFALGQAWVAMCLVLLPCLASGAVFPAVLRAMEEASALRDGGQQRESNAVAMVGRLYFGNTLGAILGSLLAGFVLVPRLGLWRAIEIAGVGSAVLAGLAFVVDSISRAARRGASHRGPGRAMVARALAVAPILGAIALALVVPRFDPVLWNRGLYRESVSGEARQAKGPRLSPGDLLFAREGRNASVAVFRVEGGATLFVSGKPDASTNRGDTPTQLLLGHLPLLCASSPERVLVIGYGSGMTVGAVLAHPEVRSVDAVELEPAVIEASPYFESINRRPLADPRCHLTLEDGRLFLEESASSYDVITSEPSNPWMAGIANLFTTDFYREVRRHLRPNGVFAQWIQNYRISDQAFQTILASLHAEFPHLLVFRVNLGDFMVLASNDPIRVPFSVLEQRFAQPEVVRTLAEIGIRSPLDLGFFLLLPEEATTRLASAAERRNTDDNVWLEHRMPIELVRSALPGRDADAEDGDVALRLAKLGAGTRLAGLEQLWPGWPLDAGLEAMIRFPNEVEPFTVDGDWFFDPWGDLREVQLDGARAELRARDRVDLLPRLEQWAGAGDALRTFREEASRGLVAARREGRLDDAMLRETLAVVDLPLALTFAASRAQAAGDLTSAEAYFVRALRHPESDSYLDALLGCARLLRDRGEVDRAAALAGEAAERFPYCGAPFVLASSSRRPGRCGGGARVDRSQASLQSGGCRAPQAGQSAPVAQASKHESPGG